jgi:hypothetical protein
MNIASHNGGEEFVFPIRSSTMENTCSGTFLKHYEFTGSFEAIRRTGRVAGGVDPLRNEARDEYEDADVGGPCGGLRHGGR